jgi:hypothetical protein
MMKLVILYIWTSEILHLHFWVKPIFLSVEGGRWFQRLTPKADGERCQGTSQLHQLGGESLLTASH